MINRPRLANPSVVRQAPDNKALNFPTQLIIGSQQLSTPPIAQEYFEPGVNTKLNRRRRPKTDYTLPSDMPKYPLGFVPVNQSPGANGEEPAQIVVKEGIPADLMDMFTKISAQQAAESRAVEEAKVSGRADIGSLVAREYQNAMTERQTDARAEKLVKAGFSAEETDAALRASKLSRAIAMAKEAVPSAAVSVEAALEDRFPRKTQGVTTGTQVEAEPGKELITYQRIRGVFTQPRRTGNELLEEALGLPVEGARPTGQDIRKYFAMKKE